MVAVVTKNGKNQALKRMFGATANPFAYMAVGKSANVPTENSTALGQECTSGTETGYSRVAVSNTFDAANKRVVSEATFITTNISVATTLKEIGLFDNTTGGNPWCIIKIADTIKDGTKSLKFKITTTVV